MGHTSDNTAGDIVVRPEKKVQRRIQKPGRYIVVLLNDDYTPMEFVVWILTEVFHRSQAESTRLMLEVHNKGRGVAGSYSHDVARTKAYQVRSLAEKEGHPLQCIIEKARDEEGSA